MKPGQVLQSLPRGAGSDQDSVLPWSWFSVERPARFTCVDSRF